MSRMKATYDLHHALTLARDLARDLDLAPARDLAFDLDRALALDLDHASARDLAPARDLAHDLHRALSDARDLALDLDLAPARDLARARDLAHELAGALIPALAPDLTLELAGALAPDRGGGLAPELAFDLARTLADARTLALDLDHVLSPVVAFHQRLSSVANANPRHIPSAVPQSHYARRLTAQLVRLLPADDQARYREEFAAELDGLVEAGMTRLAQLAYALRLSMRIWSLRSALRAEAPAPRRS